MIPVRKVLVFGTFDGLHQGHLNFFKQAKSYGDSLTVVVARDATVEKIKHHQPSRKERKRLKDVQACKLVNKALLGNKRNYYKIIKEVNPDVICLGYDQKFLTKDLRNELKKMSLKVKIYRMKPYKPEKFHSALYVHARRKSFNQ